LGKTRFAPALFSFSELAVAECDHSWPILKDIAEKQRDFLYVVVAKTHKGNPDEEAKDLPHEV